MGRMTRVVQTDGAVLAFGGPYGNLQATSAVLAEAGRRGIPPEHIVCTGDVAAYCAEPAETIALVRASGIAVVAGNCDIELGRRGDTCGCGFTPGSTCDRLARDWFAHADAGLSTDNRAWLAGLPSRIDLDIGAARLAVIHGGSDEVARYLFASTPARLKSRDLELADVDGIIAGHCGLPFTQAIGGRLWHNAGVVGMPANDGTPRVWYSILTPQSDGLTIEHCALDYDHAGAAGAMQLAGLPRGYRLALSSGLWPSCDVLPREEIRQAGVRLEPGQVEWRPPGRANQPRRTAHRSVAGKLKAVAVAQLWPAHTAANARPSAPQKFSDPAMTADGQQRAEVGLVALDTLWLNTGTLCNVTCLNCYIESSPRNDRLAYLTPDDVRPFLEEIEAGRLGTREIGFTGGEPFMNPHVIELMEMCLERDFDVLMLTNAMRPMQRHKSRLGGLVARFPEQMTIRVSLDHYAAARHEEERGPGTFAPSVEGLVWLARNGFRVSVAARTMWGEPEAAARAGFARLFAEHAIDIDAADPTQLVLFPEMDETVDVPEITTACWDILGKRPSDIMCATSRMVVKRKGAEHAAVVACTLLPYDTAFELGPTLATASGAIPLNHAHCARFCVLGGASCSPQSKAVAALAGHGTVDRLEAPVPPPRTPVPIGE